MRRVVPLTCVLLFGTMASAFAQQQRLFVITALEAVELDPRPATLGAVLRRTRLPAAVSPKAVPFLGGEYLALAAPGDGAVVLLSTRNGSALRFTFPGFSAASVLGTDGSTRLAVLGTSASGSAVLVADVRSATVRVVDVGPLGFGQPIAYAPAGDLLFVARRRGPSLDTFHDIDIVQASTGALLRTLDIWPVNADALLTNSAGTRLVVTDALDGTVTFDVASGLSLGRNASPPLQGTLFTPTADELRNRLLVNIVLPDSGNPEFVAWRGISAFSADTLQFLGRVRVPDLPLPPPTPQTAPGWTEAFDVSGLSATVFVLQGVSVGTKNGPTTCQDSQLVALDAETGAVRRTVGTTAALGPGACGASLVRLTEPIAPAAPTTNLSGRRVVLEWPATVGASGYRVEAGSAPGLANLATIGVTDPRLVVDDVPPGTYVLRVRATNAIGASAASAEVTLVVP